MRNYQPAVDSLGDVRDAIRALQALEKQLRQQLLDAGQQTCSGTRFRVCIEQKSQKRFDRTRLPVSVVNDPNNWRTETRTYVRVFPVDSVPKARLPIRAATSSSIVEDDDFEVIET